jgi:predicted DNA-binding transcriptional regulator YafY
MRHMQSYQRVLYVLRLLSDRRRGGLTAGELVELTGKNRRTILRDLAAIRGAGFKLEAAKVEKFGRKRFRVKP